MGIGDWAQCPILNLIIKINNLLNKFNISYKKKKKI